MKVNFLKGIGGIKAQTAPRHALHKRLTHAVLHTESQQAQLLLGQNGLVPVRALALVRGAHVLGAAAP